MMFVTLSVAFHPEVGNSKHGKRNMSAKVWRELDSYAALQLLRKLGDEVGVCVEGMPELV
jgi:hypothetical protein